MGNKNILKKTAFGGFKKEDVINYIEILQQEIVDLKKERNDCLLYKKDFEMLKSSKEESEKQLSEQKAENEALKTKNSELIEMNATLNLKAEEMAVNNENNNKKIAEYEDIISNLKRELADVTITKKKEAEKILSDAKETARTIIGNAEENVKSAKDDVVSVTNRIKTVCVNFESASNSLKSSADELLAVLVDAEEKLNKKNF